MDKAFDSLDHDFLSPVLRKCWVLPSITWTEILLKDQPSCVINGGTTTQHFNIERRSNQGDSISAYLVILMGGVPKRSLHPKTCHTYPTMMKLDTVIPYLNQIKKKNELRDTPLDFCWHQHFFTGNQQIFLYQEIQI